MANDFLKEVFQEMHSKIVDSVDPDSVMDVLISKKVISSHEYERLYSTPVLKECCRQLMTKLHCSHHPQTFIYLRLALLHDYSWIVDEIDERLTSAASQLLQLHLGHSTDGKLHLL